MIALQEKVGNEKRKIKCDDGVTYILEFQKEAKCKLVNKIINVRIINEVPERDSFQGKSEKKNENKKSMVVTENKPGLGEPTTKLENKKRKERQR